MLYSEWLLQPQELCQALRVEITLEYEDLDPEKITVLRTLLASSLGLVTVQAYVSGVGLVHFTLQE